MSDFSLGPFVAFLLTASAGVGLSIVSFLVARRAGLAPIQMSLIDTLQDNTSALALRVAQLETEVQHLSDQRALLEKTIIRLRQAVSDLAEQNSELRLQLKMPPRNNSMDP
jgi:septal ring factor EnvC (AmiA/AmiB activator)